MINLRINLNKPLRFYIMENTHGCLSETDITVDIPAENWKPLLEYPPFVEMLDRELESLADDPDGNKLLTAFLPFAKAIELLSECFEFISDSKAKKAQEYMNKVIEYPENDNENNLYLSFDFYKETK